MMEEITEPLLKLMHLQSWEMKTILLLMKNLFLTKQCCTG